MRNETNRGVKYINQAECMRCGRYYYANMLSIEERTHYLVCKKCIEPWPEVDFPRIHIDNPTPSHSFHDTYNDVPLCLNHFSTPGVARPGCATPGVIQPPDFGPLI